MATKTRTLIAPRIHLNGTCVTDLLDAIDDAYAKISDAIDALRKCAPNGRDYYVISSNAIVKAQDEHADRMRRLHTVQLELEAIATGIHDNVTEVHIDE